jgi:hypothetical protein
MRNVIFDMHPSPTPKKTYFMSNEHRVVDGLWATPGIQVTRCGYLEPREFTGNHSLLWADISFASALGHNPPDPISPQARRLKLGYSHIVDKYLAIYEKLIHRHNLIDPQLKLEASTQVGLPLTPEQAQEAEAIDILRTKCMLKAERRCRKLRMGAIQFSPALAKAIKELAFWDIALRRKFPTTQGSDPERQQRAQLSSRLWRRKKKAAGIKYKIGNMSKAEMEGKRRQAKDAYVKAKGDHEALRTKFLDTLPEKDRVRLQRHEEQRKIGRSAKWITGKLESKSVTKVEWQGQEMTSRNEIEHTLLEVNRAKNESVRTHSLPATAPCGRIWVPSGQRKCIGCVGGHVYSPGRHSPQRGTTISCPPHTPQHSHPKNQVPSKACNLDR